MSLTLAYEIARGGLMANSTLTSVVSRNIANVDNPNAARKSAPSIATAMGVRLGTIGNVIATSLLESVLSNTSKASSLGTITSALDRLASTVSDTALEVSPSAMLTKLQSSLYAAAAEPGNEALLGTVLHTARDVATTITSAAKLVQDVRVEANASLSASVAQLETLLSDFERVNQAVVNGTILGNDVTDQIDERNGLLRQLSELIDIHPTTRDNNDMVLFAANGTTLFETVPRKISMEDLPISPGQPGGRLTIDGVTFSGSGASQLGGKIGGLLQVRDDISVRYGRQLDEIARGLIEAFAESDQSAVPLLADATGLFTYPGGPALPAGGVAVDGLALSIFVNPNADPELGGSLSAIRDGGIAGNPVYVNNPSGVSGFSERLREMAAMLSQAQAFDPAAGLESSTSLLAFASTSAGWVEGQRSDFTSKLETSQVLNERAMLAWQGQVGVNLDEEMASLMSLERSYQATARLISTVDSMFAALLQATE
jgi:flagellar hook-associated protein 1 FlgK